jgi:hypothetical protein
MSRFPSAWQAGLDASREDRRIEYLREQVPEIWTTCNMCCGEGGWDEPRQHHDDTYFCVVIKCPSCNGSGWECIG